MEKKSVTVQEKRDCLDFISTPNLVNATRAKQAREITKRFGFYCSRERLNTWLVPTKKAEIYANSDKFKSSSKHASGPSKVKPQMRVITLDQIKFEEEVCEELFLQYDRRNICLQFIIDTTNKIHKAKYPNLKPSLGRTGKLGNMFGEDYCRQMAKRNGWGWKTVMGTKKAVPAHVDAEETGKSYSVLHLFNIIVLVAPVAKKAKRGGAFSFYDYFNKRPKK